MLAVSRSLRALRARHSKQLLSSQLLRRRQQFQKILFLIAVVLLPRCRQAFFGEEKSALPLLERKHGFHGSAAITKICRISFDEFSKCTVRLLAIAVFGENLGAAQLVIVATASLVMFGVEALALVDELQGFVRLALGQRMLHQKRVP